MAAGKRKHSLFFGITSRTLMTISAGLLIVSYLSIYVNPAKAWFMTIFGLLFFPLLICNSILLVWALLRRSRAVVIPLVALAPAFLISGKFFRIAPTPEPPSGGLKIVSYNVGRFALPQDGNFSSRMECADSVMAFLRSENADIICLQEFYMQNREKVLGYLSRQMKGYDIKYYVNVNNYGSYGNVTLSRYPALSKGHIDFEHSSNLALYSDYCIGGDTLRVYNCHFESYNISLSRLATGLEKDYRKAMKDTEEKMRRSIVRRPRQVDQVLGDIEKCRENVIVAGDFNDTPMSYTYWRLSRRRKDSFEEAGSGSGATFSRLRPFLRIDYILFPESYKALYHNVVDKGFSDHYPVEAVISR